MTKYIVDSMAYNPTVEHNQLAWAAVGQFAARNQNHPMQIGEYAQAVPPKHDGGNRIGFIQYLIAHKALVAV